jgi:hypothetical protein
MRVKQCHGSLKLWLRLILGDFDNKLSEKGVEPRYVRSNTKLKNDFTNQNRKVRFRGGDTGDSGDSSSNLL